MNSHKSDIPTITGEIPVSLNQLAIINAFAVDYLKLKGLFYVLLGLTWLFYQSPSRLAGLEWISFLTPEIVGGLWIFSGSIGILMGYFGTQRLKRMGFFALIIVPTVIGFYFAISWIVYMLPGASADGYERGLASTAVYWAFSVSAYVMARVYSASSGGIEKEVGGVRP